MLRAKTIIEKAFLVMGFVLIMSSCFTTRQYKAEMLFPASVDLPFEGRNIGLMSSVELLNDLPKFSAESWRVDSLLYNEIMVAAGGIVGNGPTYTLLNIDLDKEKLLSTRNAFSSNVMDYLDVIMPDSLEILFYLETLQMEYKFLKDTLFSIPEEFRGSIISASKWRFYDLQNQDYKYYYLSDTMTIFSNIAFSENVGNPYHPDFQDLFMQAAHEHGQSFGRIIAPYWHDVVRVYFDSYFLFRGAKKFVQNGEWKQAAEIWNKYTISSDDFIASRACFNMAVASEMAGYVENAIIWLDKAENKGMTEMVEQYRLILMNRKSFIKSLDTQLGEIINK